MNDRERVTNEPVLVGKPVLVGDIIDMLPARYVDTLRNNENARPCCRQVETNMLERYKTSPDLPGPDLLVFVCECGARHKRFAAAGKK